MRKKKQYDNNMILIIAILAALLLLSYGWGFGHMGSVMFFGPVFMILVLFLVVWLVVSLTQNR